jgi:uncharacterized membrane protein YgdD (TMEM256/DUF423 family)
MSPWSRVIVAFAGLYGASGVGLAAWAAHRSGSERLMTAALFLILHAGPLAAIGLAVPRRSLLLAASVLALGAFLFSGDIALSLLAGLRPWPLAAPAGGMLLIAGWLWLAAAGLFLHRVPDRP